MTQPLSDTDTNALKPCPLTFIQCGGENDCDHDFQGWRKFDDELGGETVCAKCGVGAMEADQWKD